MCDLINKWNLTLAQRNTSVPLMHNSVLNILKPASLFQKPVKSRVWPEDYYRDTWINRQQHFWVFVPADYSSGNVSPEERKGRLINCLKIIKVIHMSKKSWTWSVSGALQMQSTLFWGTCNMKILNAWLTNTLQTRDLTFSVTQKNESEMF